MSQSTVRLDLRAVIAIGALGVVIFAIIFVQLCGKEDVPSLAEAETPVPLDTATPETTGPTATEGPTSTPGGPTPTAEVQVSTEGEERDIQRQYDLALLGQALEEYHEGEGDYPDSGGNIQTLCAFPDIDVACELGDILTPLPDDPKGDPGANGYWYASDGSSYVIYAQRESEAFEACEEHPDHLQEFDSVFCLQEP